jgi:hypothetical protein
MSSTDFWNRFYYHAPDAEAVKRHEDVRSRIRNVALSLDNLLPEGREKSLAITKLEEAMFWANAAIARSGD